MRIGVDLGGTKIEAIMLDNGGNTVEKIRVDTPNEKYPLILEQLCSVIKEMQKKSPKQLPVGIGTPGALSSDQVMKNCNSIQLNGMPLKIDVESQLGYEVRIENDANCFALSEAHYGAARDATTMFGVIIGTGTGGGVVINKQLLTGPNNIAGEWGHNSIPSSVLELAGEKRICYCGRSNCIETYLSGRGLSQTHFELNNERLDAREIASMADKNDASCQMTIDIYSQQLARCLASVINLLDPHTIVLGGGLSNIDALYEKVPEYLLPFIFNDKVETRLTPPKFGDASGARGAACLW